MALLGSLDDPSLPIRLQQEDNTDRDSFMRSGSLGKDKKEFRFRPISPVVRAVNVAGVKHGKVPLSPLALKHHDSLSAPQSEYNTPSASSNGVPQLIDLTSSTVSNEMDNKPTSQPRSPSRSNSDWESLQIQVKGRTASLMELSDARLSDHQNDVSVVNDILADHRMTTKPTVRSQNETTIRLTAPPNHDDDDLQHPPTHMSLHRPVSNQTTTTTHLSEIHESESEFEEYHDEDDPLGRAIVQQQQQQQQQQQSTHRNHHSTSSSSQPEIRLLKSESTASTVIIHDYSRHTSIPEESEIAAIVPFLEEDEEVDDDDDDDDDSQMREEDSLDEDDEKAVTTANVSRQTTRRSTTNGQSMELFRLHMADRIRSRFDRILMDLDARVEVQRRNFERLSRR